MRKINQDLYNNVQDLGFLGEDVGFSSLTGGMYYNFNEVSC